MVGGIRRNQIALILFPCKEKPSQNICPIYRSFPKTFQTKDMPFTKDIPKKCPSPNHHANAFRVRVKEVNKDGNRSKLMEI